MKNSIYIITVFLCILVHSVLAQIDITINGRQPYPVLLDNYLEDFGVITAKIRNNAGTPASLKIFATIDGPSGLHVGSREPSCILEIGANITSSFGAGNYDNLCLEFNASDVDYGDLTAEQQVALQLYKILPEGDYTYCLMAKDSDTDAILATNCLSFQIQFPDRPSLIHPADGSEVDGTIKPTFNVTWSHVITDNVLRLSTKYNVKIISLGDNGGEFPNENDATIIMNDANVNPIYNEQDVNSTHAVSINDLQLISGHFYAVRITAYNVDFDYPSESSQSNINIFQYNESDFECGQSFLVEPIFPVHNSIIPFNTVVPVVRYQPYCDTYEKFTHDTKLKSNSIELDNFIRTLRWRKGPRVFFESSTLIPDPDGFYSSHIAVGDYNDMPILQHNVPYTWSTSGEMRLKKGKTFKYNVGDITFASGMPPVQLTYPIGGALISPGNVNFTAIHDQVPEMPLPPFKVKQIIDEEAFEYPPLEVNELAILQVSKHLNFDTVIHASSIPIQGSDQAYVNSTTRMYDVSAFISSIYRNLEFNKTFEDTITYFWRIAWAKIPANFVESYTAYVPTSSLYYNISEIDSFRVSTNAGNDVVVNNTTTPNDNNTNAQCKSQCEIPAIVNSNDFSGALENETIKIGQFNLEIVQFTKSGNTYSGEGLIEIPFIRKVKLKASFTNIKVNSDKVVYQGAVIGKESGNELETLNSLLLGQQMELPFGWDTTLNNIHLTLAITGITFHPTNAFMQVSLDLGDALSLLHESDNYPILTTEICFQPGGYEKDIYLYAQNDITLDENESGYGFEFKGGQSLADTTGMTYIKWGCNGFVEMQLGGAVTFAQDLLLKDSGLTSDDAPINERVKGHFTFKYNYLHQDVMITARMEDFQFVDHLKGWGFDSDTIFIDLSDNSNPPNFVVPEGYGSGYFNNPATANTWKGVYIPRSKVLSPESFINEGYRATMGYSTMILGDGIYYLRHRAFNVVNEGIIGKLSATIDTIDGVVSNVDFRYRMSGKIQMPFVEEGAYLNYSGLYDNATDWNLIVQVGNDSIVAPIFMSHLTLYQNSLISFGKDPVLQRTRFRFLLNGHLTADDGLKNASYIKHLKNVKLPKVSFEEMEYETYKGFINKPIFGLASPAKSLNGFPIQIDSIDFTTYNGNPGLYIKPKLVLVGENNGFSVAVGLIFYAEMNLTGPKDEFLNPNASLSDINIDIVKSGFKLKGYIRFISDEADKGIEGTLAATLPSGIEGYFKAKFGNYGSNSGAAFGSAGYYNYWYVDAMLAFGSSGFPIFSGVNLYGLGGGLWYNMKQDTTFKVNVTNMMAAAATPPNGVNTSGIPYNRNFGSGYGLRLRGLFGNPGGGDKFNMLLTVQAQFPESGGPIVKLRGDVYLMSKLQSINAEGKIDETQKAFWGFAEMEYNGQEHFINAVVQMNVLIKANASKIIEGIGPNSRMVNAHFHAKTAGENYWYLLVGTPDERGGIKMDLQIKKASAEGYAMFGYGIPIQIPEPDSQFMSMLNNKKDNYSSSSGDPNSILNKPIDLNGYGIAFGAVVKDSFNFNYQPFYLKVKLIMGFDFNLTKNSERKCVETGNVPGYNDWYGMGQLYAGIGGEFGIHVDLWFIEGDYQIFQGSIATLMSGGLPNPSWFHCRGTMKYKVLGLIEGSHSFELNVGQKCTFGNGNPFGDSPVIIDTKPKDGEVDVSVFTLPTVSYAFAVHEVLSFYDEKIDNYRQFKLLINTVTLKSTTFDYAPSTEFDNDKYVSFHIPQKVLKASTNHTFYVKVKSKEKLLSNGQWVYIKEGDSDWVEEKTIHFKTGIKPDSIDPRQLDYTYPLHQQRFFMKGETVDDKGIIRLNNVDDQLLYKNHPVNNLVYHYELHFNSLQNDVPTVKVLASADDYQNITFKVDQLNPNQTYRASLRRVKGTYNSSNLTAYTPSSIMASYSNATFNKTKNGEYDYKVLPARMVSLGNAASASVEKELYNFYFKTSKYVNLAEKVESLTWKDPKYNLPGFLEDVIIDAVNPIEGFDVFDMEGFKRQPSNGTYENVSGLIKTGVHYHVGENYGEVQNFNFLNNDVLLTQNNSINFFIPYLAKQNHTSFLAYIKSKVSTEVYTSLSNSLNGAMNSLVLKLDATKIAKQNYNATLGPFSMPTSSNGISVDLPNLGVSLSPPAPLPPKKLEIRLEYGTQYFIADFKNKSCMADYMYLGGPYLKVNNLSLYNKLSAFINSAVNGTIQSCQNANFGMIYKYPWLNNKTIGTKWKHDYITPGQCIQDID